MFHRPTLSQVQLHDPFWSPYLKKIRTVMVPHVLDKMEEVGYLDNFRFGAAGQTEHKGPPFSDGLLLETIRGVSDFIAVSQDEALDAKLDAMIRVIVNAQEKDGFLCTQTQCCYPDKRWGENGGDIIIQHDLYDQGALIEAGVHHYLATGKTALLTCAVRAAKGIVDYMGPGKANRIPGHSLPEEAMVKLYRLFRDHADEPAIATLRATYDIALMDFLHLAQFWYDGRGDYTGRTLSYDKRFAPPYNQDHLPFAEQREAVGHAVRAMLCYTGAAVVSQEIDGIGYRPALDALWDSVTRRKMHISGGIGTRHDIEGFDVDYNLPNDAYLETCAGVGLAFWSGEMALLQRSTDYYDTFERALYNNVLASIGEDGKRYFYENPLVSDGSRSRWEWHGCPCCPPMLLKLFSSLPTYIYTLSENAVDVHLYIDSTCRTDAVTITQQAGVFTIDSHGKEITLRLRIPEYAESFTIDGVSPTIGADGYATLQGVFSPEQKFTVAYATPIRRICAHPDVEADRGRVAVMRGPLLYCAEGCDNETVDLTLAREPALTYQSDGTITGTIDNGNICTFVPYYRWNNRGACPMQVWFLQDGFAAPGDWDGKLYQAL